MKRWYLQKIERLYTDKAGLPFTDFQSRSEEVEEKEMFPEFAGDGKLLTYKGEGNYTRSTNTIVLNLKSGNSEYRYAFESIMLILKYNIEGITYIKYAISILNPLYLKR